MTHLLSMITMLLRLSQSRPRNINIRSLVQAKNLTIQFFSVHFIRKVPHWFSLQTVLNIFFMNFILFSLLILVSLGMKWIDPDSEVFSRLSYLLFSHPNYCTVFSSQKQ